jgi:hypothetical protein
VIERDTDRYVFIWTDCNETELLRIAGRFAIDEKLNFSWRDAAIVSNRVAQLRG